MRAPQQNALVADSRHGEGFAAGSLLTAMAGWPLAASAQGLSATVLSIGDDDTIRVHQAGRAITVRLACIATYSSGCRSAGR